ncbi:putative peptide methionine sulfoxide reductase [Choanephora cucurbitarum]|uniref:peptide-methionine (S)-S-oxide reductase n=1 Tax=Choanephora cucurbitarum TaxID=101091 RepID=A0A1C7NTR7_9FUNG|nr:putative peptide methionine sulfoxide reductase [Choanephora cucurbitarum]
MTTEKATFAAGCFWGVEHIYNKHFKQFDIKCKVGYIGGDIENPNYRQVCSGTTNHAEAVQIDFDPAKVSYASLVEFFYRMHDPTQLNQQGPDRGTQYRSAIFYHSPEQKEVAEKVTAEIQEKHFKGKKIVTELIPAGVFYDAESYHQKYLEKNPSGYECPTHFLHW